MKIEKLDTTLVPVWFPAAKDPHGTVKFSNAEGRGVGLVKLVLPSADGPSPRHVNDDRSWLLFKGNKLRVDGREKGAFGGRDEEEGAVVQVRASTWASKHVGERAHRR